MTIYWPASNPRVTEEAGTRGGAHTGIDLAANLNDPVLAAFDGTVVYVGGDGASGRLWLGDRWLYPNGQGKTVDIRRSDGLISRVGHLNGYAVKKGQTVKAGQVVGYAGTTGYSTGVHIHWELRWDRIWVGGRWINPRSVSPQVYRAPAPTPTPTPTPKEEDDMAKNSGFYYTRTKDKALVYLMVNLGSGIYHEFSSGTSKGMNGSYVNPIAATLDTGAFAKITESHARVIKQSCDRAFTTKVEGTLAIVDDG